MSQHPDYVGGLLLLLEAKVKGEKKVFLSAPDIIYLMNKMYNPCQMSRKVQEITG